MTEEVYGRYLVTYQVSTQVASNEALVDNKQATSEVLASSFGDAEVKTLEQIHSRSSFGRYEYTIVSIVKEGF